MRWTYAIALMALGMAGSVPSVADRPAAPGWPSVVPRLASYTDQQKTAITAVVEQYCAYTRLPKRTELQAHIRALLTPAQAVQALGYWLPQDLHRDVREFFGEPATPDDDLDTCGRPLHPSS